VSCKFINQPFQADEISRRNGYKVYLNIIKLRMQALSWLWMGSGEAPDRSI